MKKTFFGILLIVVALFYGVIAYAEESEYTAGDYKFTIEKFALRVYPITVEDGTMDTESFENYQKNSYTREVDIEDLALPEPTIKNKKIDKTNIAFVELNVDIPESKIRELLADEIENVTETQQYLAEIVVYYRVTEAPETFTKFYTNNTYKEFVKGFVEAFDSAEQYHMESNYKETSLNESNAQVINLIGISPDKFLYSDKAAEIEPPISLFNFFQFAKTAGEDPEYVLSFTNISDIDYLIGIVEEMMTDEGYDEELDTPYDLPDNPETATVVAIPDTAKSKTQLAIVIGVFLFAIGTGIVGSIALSKE